ncbi:alpha/beta fold hydrolase [Brachybacterium sp. DNPG3]
MSPRRNPRTGVPALGDYPELHPSARVEAPSERVDAASQPGGPDEPDERDEPVVLLHGGTVAGWMWAEQVEALRDRTVLALDLPGFGHRAAESWPGLEATADDVRARVRALGVDGPFHLVGLSLGAIVALRVVARHPEAVLSTFVTGTIVAPVGRATRLSARLQLALRDARWFWALQARAYGLDAEGRERFVAHALTLRRDNTVAITAEAYAGGLPAGLGPGSGRILAIAAEHDPASIRASLALIGAVAPQAVLRIAPRMHHVWNAQDPDLFTGVLRAWLRGEVDPRLTDPPHAAVGLSPRGSRPARRTARA